MSKDFLKGLARNMNTSYTENAAKGHRTTYNTLADMNFKVPSYRFDAHSFLTDFGRALDEDVIYATQFLFYMRDIRGGMGERESFRTGLKLLAHFHENVLVKILDLIPEYGRWDDLFILFGSKAETSDRVQKAVIDIVRRQLAIDLNRLDNGKPVSLLGKWMPSENTSSPETRALARDFMQALSLKPKQYRKMLVKLRTHLNIVESKMSKREWSEIYYKAVPSRANLIYGNAFLKHDFERRSQFLDSTLMEDSTVSVHSGTLYPHEIIKNGIRARTSEKEKSALAQWKALPDLIPLDGSVLVVADSSGSMHTEVSPGTSAHIVASSLAIYCSERLEGPYKDKAITFSNEPSYMDFSHCKNIVQKHYVYQHSAWDMNTNIERVFDLILHTAVSQGLSQENLPKTVLIISDMEFDAARRGRGGAISEDTLFDTIRRKFEDLGYVMPQLVFWNVASRTNTIPDYGKNISLISGFSPNALKAALNPQEDNWGQLKEVLDSERYEIIRAVLT